MPIAWLWMAVLILGYITQFGTERIDEQTFASWCDGYCDYDSNVVVAFVGILLALVTAYSLFPREHDEATIDFLRALPISRGSIFIAKFVAAWLLLCFINLVSYSIDALLLTSNPESIGGKFYSQVWFTLLWRDCLFSFVILSHGVLLSWFRTVGLIIYAIYLLLLMWAESQWGSSGNWSVFVLTSNEYDGSKLLVNHEGLLIHTVLAIAIVFIAYHLWSRAESSSSGAKESSTGTKIWQLLISVSGFILLSAFLAYQVSQGTGTSLTGELKVEKTDHYRMVYPAKRDDTVQYILTHAESDYAELAAMLGVEELPNIRVDLSAQSEHAAGLATWKKIQMDLNSFSDDVSQRRVLSHETTHVLQSVESNRKLANNYMAVKFFIEGMAQFTSFEIVPETARRESNWELASISWKRQQIDFNDLLDAAGFAERFDVELHYSLGDMWTRSFVDICGVAGLGNFIRATGREGAVSNLPGEIFWRDTMRHINCDLDTVNEHWASQMQAIFEQVPTERFPVYTDIVVKRDADAGRVMVSAELQSSEGEGFDFELPNRFNIRIARSSTQLASGVDAVFQGSIVVVDGTQRIQFKVPASAVTGSRFRYQLGYSPSAGSRYYYEMWRRGSL